MDGDAGPGDGREASCIGRLVGVDEEGACVEGAEEGGSRVPEEKDLFFDKGSAEVVDEDGRKLCDHPVEHADRGVDAVGGGDDGLVDSDEEDGARGEVV